MSRTIKLEDLRIDGDTQNRPLDQATVDHYAECMESGDEFPVVKATFDGKYYWLWDGFHRYFAYKKMGYATIELDYIPGTQEDAEDLSYGANGKHGRSRSRQEKEEIVRKVLSKERHKDKSNKEISRLCEVSDKFVATIRNPEKKAKQAENVKKHYEKKAKESAIESRSEEPKPSILDGTEPSEDELKANEMAMQADLDALNKLLEADDALATAHAEIKRLNYLVAQKEVRIAAIMKEKSECIKLCKSLQSQLDKIHRNKK